MKKSTSRKTSGDKDRESSKDAGFKFSPLNGFDLRGIFVADEVEFRVKVHLDPKRGTKSKHEEVEANLRSRLKEFWYVSCNRQLILTSNWLRGAADAEKLAAWLIRGIPLLETGTQFQLTPDCMTSIELLLPTSDNTDWQYNFEQLAKELQPSLHALVSPNRVFCGCNTTYAVEDLRIRYFKSQTENAQSGKLPLAWMLYRSDGKDYVVINTLHATLHPKLLLGWIAIWMQIVNRAKLNSKSKLLRAPASDRSSISSLLPLSDKSLAQHLREIGMDLDHTTNEVLHELTANWSWAWQEARTRIEKVEKR